MRGALRLLRTLCSVHRELLPSRPLNTALPCSMRCVQAQLEFATNWIQCHARLCAKLGKPLVIGGEEQPALATPPASPVTLHLLQSLLPTLLMLY